ncbi:Protein kinase domain-containing protein [Caenorhabditis elegans]|uniref:Protein kinase domain-containing protein n=1 Tax=Caenorhabditis elegans TaxID=6239 RepID=Q23260_CAEEL|nr:Protein kinase domain-containing protein [Caenorhabditis elegans]CAA88976.1 Protein kinase domain-containing protein [Caenorhabditis elegans]|eukprot:NP_509689.1 Myosin Light Chain Kinase related [Caenorhabditis elegans]
MGTEPSGSGKIKVDEHYPSELDEPPVFDVKKIENIRANVKFDTLYQVTKLLGDGKFGKVYCVIEKETGKEFAAKFIKIRKEADRAEVEREVSILTQLRHPRIAQIYDAFYTTTNDVVLIMEIVRGGELFDRVAEESYVLSELAVVMIICQLCEAIDYIHKQNILHLDVKPENIMCVSLTGNRIKLIDFGLARHYDGTQELKYMAGTPEFAAPEVIKFEKLDYHTDMWSIGVITYILLSGYSPFLGDNLGETYCNVEKGVWEFTEEFDTVTEEAKDFVTKLLVYDQSKRMLPHECLQHPWIAKHRQKAACNTILEKPLNAPTLDNKQIMRYNARRKFRRMIIYVKFLIEMNRLRNSLKTRMSANGHKFFDPLLKMAEKKEQKISNAIGTAGCPASGLGSLVKMAVDSQKKNGDVPVTQDANMSTEPEKEEKKKKKKIANADGSTKTEKTSSVKKKKLVETDGDAGLRPPPELMTKRASTGGESLLAAVKVLKNLEVVENGNSPKRKSLCSVKEEKEIPAKKQTEGYKTLETTENGDIRRKSAPVKQDTLTCQDNSKVTPQLLETAPNGEIRRKSASAKEEKSVKPEEVIRKKSSASVKETKTVELSVVPVKLEKLASIDEKGEKLVKKKKKTTTVTAEIEKPKSVIESKEEKLVEKPKLLNGTLVSDALEKRRSLGSKRASETQDVGLRPLPVVDFSPKIVLTDKKEPKESKTKPAEPLKEIVPETKKPARQGALRKRDKSLDDILNAAPSPTTLSKSTVTSVKHSVVETIHPSGEIIKSEKVLTKKKSLKKDKSIDDRLPVKIIEDKASLPKLKTDVVTFESKPVKKTSKIVKLIPEDANLIKDEKKPTKIVMTSEKQATTTVQTTTSVKRTTKSSEKKVEHTADGKSVESSQKKNSQKDDVKVSQVTTKKEEDSTQPAPTLTVKKNVVKQTAEKSTSEKEHKTTENKEQERIIKKSSTLKDKDVAQVSLQQSIKVNGEKHKESKVIGTKTVINKLELKGEETINANPKKSSLKKATAKVTGETTKHLEISTDGKLGVLKTKDTTSMKLSPDSSSDTSSSKNVRILLTDEQSVKSSVRSHPSVSTRDSSEERKKVRFAGDVGTPTKLNPPPLFGNGLQKMRSESSLHEKINGLTTKKSHDDVSLARKTSLFTDIEYQPREDFSFEALKEKLTRRVSYGYDDDGKRGKQMVLIPPTNSVKDKLRHFEKKFAK